MPISWTCIFTRSTVKRLSHKFAFSQYLSGEYVVESILYVFKPYLYTIYVMFLVKIVSGRQSFLSKAITEFRKLLRFWFRHSTISKLLSNLESLTVKSLQRYKKSGRVNLTTFYYGSVIIEKVKCFRLIGYLDSEFLT